MSATVTKETIGPGVVIFRGTDWNPKLGEIYFGPEGSEREDGRAHQYSMPRPDGTFDVTRSDLPSGTHNVVFFQLLGDLVTVDVTLPEGVSIDGG